MKIGGGIQYLIFKHAKDRNLIIAISRGLAHAGMNGSSISPVYDKKLMKMIKEEKEKQGRSVATEPATPKNPIKYHAPRKAR